MPHRRLIACALLAAVACAPLLAAGSERTRAAAGTAAQTSSQDGVKITVEPRGFPPGAKTWEFAITLETHTQPLDDDLVRMTTLLADGKTRRPLRWEGAPPGGHHRKGVLRFEALTPLPHAVELQIRRRGEEGPRIFRWQLGTP